jgi:hypothetical protein
MEEPDEGASEAEAPAVFHHVVALRDGRQIRLSGPRIYPVGTHIEVSVWRGGVTGRLWARGPYRVLREDDDLIPDSWGRATK